MKYILIIATTFCLCSSDSVYHHQQNPFLKHHQPNFHHLVDHSSYGENNHFKVIHEQPNQNFIFNENNLNTPVAYQLLGHNNIAPSQNQHYVTPNHNNQYNTDHLSGHNHNHHSSYAHNKFIYPSTFTGVSTKINGGIIPRPIEVVITNKGEAPMHLKYEYSQCRGCKKVKNNESSYSNTIGLQPPISTLIPGIDNAPVPSKFPEQKPVLPVIVSDEVVFPQSDRDEINEEIELALKEQNIELGLREQKIELALRDQDTGLSVRDQEGSRPQTFDDNVIEDENIVTDEIQEFKNTLVKKSFTF